MRLKSTLLGIACAIVTPVVFAQTETITTTTTTTTSTGTITEYSPGSTFVVKEISGPVSYRYGETITYVTRSGKTLTDDEVITRVKIGTPVSVHFSTEGDDRIINRVEIDDDEIEIEDD
jgi:ligand-binding SRPBCC domain-containing protein